MKYYIINELNREKIKLKSTSPENLKGLGSAVDKRVLIPFMLLFLKFEVLSFVILRSGITVVYGFVIYGIIALFVIFYVDHIKSKFLKGEYNHIKKNTLEGKIQFWVHYSIPVILIFVPNIYFKYVLIYVFALFGYDFKEFIVPR